MPNNDRVLDTMLRWVKGEISTSQADKELGKIYVACRDCGKEIVNPVMIEDEPYCPACAGLFWHSLR